jgi:dihydroorotase
MSTRVDLVITGAEVITGGYGPFIADVAIADGKIAGISMPGSMHGAEQIDARSLVLLPGAVDLHVHLRDPGLEHKETFADGTAAAACGGVTTVCDMPNTRPPVINVERFEAKRKIAQAQAHVDFGLWAGGMKLDEFRGLQAEGALGLKIYMNRSHRADDPYTSELSMPDGDALRDTLARCAELDMLAAVHVCNHEAEAAERARLSSVTRTDAKAVCRSYRNEGALDGLSRVIEAARVTGARVHIAHVSLAPITALGLVEQARCQGVAITCESGPPALLEADLDRLGVFGVPFAFPPEEAAAYWDAIRDGLIDAIATDHAPHTRAEKEAGNDDVWAAPPGYPGVETSLPLMLDAALRGNFTLARLVEVMSTGPARIANLPRKGSIAVGADADLVLVDPNGEHVVDENLLHSKAGWSPFHGRALRGRLVRTILRGQTIAADGQLLEIAPSGRQVAPEPRKAATSS